ncbi:MULTISPECIES: DUF2281 domain-containing protein [Fischerella]|uniref:DUF2281 domain-containing protein n=1 Tax=Fischerella muscicola CCMEE 5323 TaxID=2019572 RepID=A0A2N6K0Y5_FISMU|nr:MULTISPECIES: DUF2281 domain-containing protein [Fischerella]MBD2433765.1 DUF2281 domain-containing protein [Fischerella sp. FACHB-380]PLZ88013.1 DUF2281 domain-containing protein [Fischerella muscicola CCMEE 5323]
MSTEQLLLEKWRSLPLDKQQEVLDFVEFLEFRQTSTTRQPVESTSKSKLGEHLRKIREEIIASGTPMLDWNGIEREKAERRGGYQQEAE